MKIGQKVMYDGFKLDSFPEDVKSQTLIRRKESGKVTQMPSNDWIEVTLNSGIRVAMESTRMEYACGLGSELI